MSSVEPQTPYNEYTGNGVTTVFPYEFQLLASSDLVVTVNGVVIPSSDFVLTGVGVQAGGDVTFNTAPANGAEVLLSRVIVLKREIDYQYNGPLPEATVDLDFNRLWQALQGISAILGGAVRAPYPEQVPALPVAASRANTMLGFDALGNPTVMAPVSGSAADVLIQLANGADQSKGSTLVADQLPYAGAVSNTQRRLNREIVSVWRFGAYGDGTLTTVQMYAALTAAWNSAITYNHDLFFPRGTYDTGIESMPFRQQVVASLLDCNNLTLWCEGPATVFQTTSVNGADVFQINGLKNFHIRGFPTIKGTISGSSAGTNGVSITNGGENLSFEIRCLNLPSLDKTTHYDGGKAFTIQPATGAFELRSIHAIVHAVGCAEGFGYEPHLVTSLTKKTTISVELYAEDCHIAYKQVSGAATAAITASFNSGVRVRGLAVNCQKYVALNRAHGTDVDMNVITTKTAAQRRLNPSGVAWFAPDAVVEALYCVYAKNARIKLSGSNGAADYKARIGGTTAGSSGLNGATEYCDIDLDLSGTSATADIATIDSGGNTARDCDIRVTALTASAFPAEINLASNRNRLRIGAIYRGTFTATLTGCTTSPTGTVTWTVDGSKVTLQIPTITATSNTNLATLTGLPAHLIPAVNQLVVGRNTDNGTTVASLLGITTGGVIELYNGVTSGIFTTSGTKGCQNITVTYDRA